MEASSSSSHYSALISTIGELKADLERTVSRLQSVENENRNLQQNYQQVKSELIQTRKKYIEARDNYTVTVTEKLEAERSYEAFMDKVKIQLTEKTREFEALRTKFAPQDMDFIRIKVQEELEIPHRQKIQLMEAEVEESRQQFYLLKRELERSKAEYEAYSDNQRREVIAIREDHEAVVNALREQLDKFQRQEFLFEKDELIRSLKVRDQEQSQLVVTMKEELRLAVHERDTAKHQIGEQKRAAEEALMKLRSRLAAAEAEKFATDHKHSLLVQELERKDAQLRVCNHNLEEASAAIDQLRAQVRGAEARVVTLTEDYTSNVNSLKCQHELEKRDLNQLIEQLTERIGDREDALRKAQREAAEMQSRSEVHEAEMRRQHQNYVTDAAQRYAALESELTTERNNIRVREMQYSKINEKLVLDVETTRAELGPLRREKEALHQKLRETDADFDAEKKRASQMQKDAEMYKFRLDELQSSSQNKVHALESRLALLKEAENRVPDKIKAILDDQERERAEFQRQLQRVHTENKDALNRREQEIKQRYDDKAKQIKYELAKERKRADAYKKLAAESRSREKSFTEAALTAAASEGGGLGHVFGANPELLSYLNEFNAGVLGVQTAGSPSALEFGGNDALEVLQQILQTHA